MIKDDDKDVLALLLERLEAENERLDRLEADNNRLAAKCIRLESEVRTLSAADPVPSSSGATQDRGDSPARVEHDQALTRALAPFSLPGKTETRGALRGAVDPCGNEISVEESVLVDVPYDGVTSVALRFEEVPVGEARVRDSFVIQLVRDPSGPWIVLAGITTGGNRGVAIDTSVRRPLTAD